MQWLTRGVIQLSIISTSAVLCPFSKSTFVLFFKVCWVFLLTKVAMDNAESKSSICSQWWSWILVVESARHIWLVRGDTFHSECSEWTQLEHNIALSWWYNVVCFLWMLSDYQIIFSVLFTTYWLCYFCISALNCMMNGSVYYAVNYCELARHYSEFLSRNTILYTIPKSQWGAHNVNNMGPHGSPKFYGTSCTGSSSPVSAVKIQRSNASKHLP